MDPHIYSDQPGWSSDSSKSDDGVNYLRRLKGALPKSTPEEPPANCGGNARSPLTEVNANPLPFNPPSNNPVGSERRHSPRLHCSGSAEFQVAGSEFRTWGTLADISVQGCYLEMNNTFPVDTQVSLVLKSCGSRIQCLGRICTSYPGLGMGISFTEIDPDQQIELQRLVSMLAAYNAPARTVAAPEIVTKKWAGPADPQALLDEITEYFRTNPILSRDEFHQIADRVRRL